MVTPNAAAKMFNEWMINSGIVRLTPAQTTVSQEIIAAVDIAGDVTDNTWKNFLKYSPQYYQIWIQSEALSS